MCDSAVILRLYSCVLHDHKINYKVNEADIRTAIQNMKEVYKPNPGSLSDSTVNVADYNDAGHRCAYLHKYAPFHTALVADMLLRALQQNPKLFSDLIIPSRKIHICSLGGGPGTDIFGVLSVLNAAFGIFQVSATVIDYMGKWKDMFYELVTELRYGNYSALGESVSDQYFEWKYLQHNLLGKMTNQVNKEIGKANLVTMIKFVSASSCKDTSAMIRKIFGSLKHGALVLYIDNAGGGFHKLVTKEAENCNFESVFYQNHERFVKPSLQVRKFGYTPCFDSRVSVHIWRKTLSKKKSYSPRYSYNDNSSPLSTIEIPSPEKNTNRLHNETSAFDNKIPIPSTSAESSKFMNKGLTDFQQTSYTKICANNVYGSDNLTAKTFDNSLGKSSQPEKKLCPKGIPTKESVEYGISKNTNNSNRSDIYDKPLQMRPITNSVTASYVKKVTVTEDSTEPQRKVYPKEILAEEFAQYGISRNTINADLVTKQLHETSQDTVSNVKNIKTFQHAIHESLETRMTTNRREVASEASLPSQNASVTFSWVNYIRDIFYQELISLITGEFINLSQEHEMNAIPFDLSLTVGERFLHHLFESA